MNALSAAVVGFDITPRFDLQCGAWGTSSFMTELDMPLMARCVALEQGGRRLFWYGCDLIGERIPDTHAMRDEIADGLGVTRDQIVWSTSQTHSSGALPGSGVTGSRSADLSKQNPAFVAAERDRFFSAVIGAGREAIACLQPVKLRAGRGHCDSISYNRRLPMPTGGNKFSRSYAEGLQSGKFFDPTIGLLRFDDRHGKPLGLIFNFCAHPATMIQGKWISPDWVGTARQVIEEALGAPAMFVQGFCGDVNCYHIFGTPDQARRTGARLGKAAVEALPSLIPARGEPLDFRYENVALRCREMYTEAELDREIAMREAYVAELEHDPGATWVGGYNVPEQFGPDVRAGGARRQIEFLNRARRMVESGESPPAELSLPIGAIRVGDVGALLSVGENFTMTGHRIRLRSPLVHTLICGDTNGVFGYIGDDEAIDRGGYETEWKTDWGDGLRLPPARGTADRIIDRAVELLESLCAS